MILIDEIPNIKLNELVKYSAIFHQFIEFYIDFILGFILIAHIILYYLEG